LEQRAKAVAAVMAAAAIDLPTQLAQTTFRMSLVSGWGIRPGASVLEIGCGQGDMTAALADAVGRQGRVVAVDIADPSYGTPITIGQSAEVLRSSVLGERLDIRLGFDVLDAANQFPDNAFDYLVFSHSSWYFTSLDQLHHSLRVIRPWAPSLCFAEWDLRPDDTDQLPHLLAVLVQGQLNANSLASSGNVRTPFSRETLERVLDSTGWQVDQRHRVPTTGLQDADWEITASLELPDSTLVELPERSRDLLVSQLDVLRSIARRHNNQPLPTYQIVASRK
jgi:SAM-dependent methyltransferase